MDIPLFEIIRRLLLQKMSEFEYTIADEINSEEGQSEKEKEDNSSVIVIEDDDNDEMEGVEKESTAADDERERRYREYMNESFHNFTMNNSFVGERSREESEFDEIHEFINEVESWTRLPVCKNRFRDRFSGLES